MLPRDRLRRDGARRGARPLEEDELDRDDVAALVQHLEVGVLRVRSRLAPDDGAGRERQRRAAPVDALAVAFHLELLQEGGQPLQRLRVGRDAAAREAVEVAVPDVDEAEQHRHVALDRRAREVLVHRARAGEQLAKALGADRDRDRQADRRPERIAPADPVPEAEGARDAEARRRLDVARRGDEMLVDPRAAAGDEPLPRRLGVGHRFLRREGLAGDDEERLVGGEAGERRRQVGAVDVGDEMEREVARGEAGERADDHLRAEIAAADADVDDVAQARRRGAAPARRPRRARAPIRRRRASRRGRRGPRR